MVMDCTVLLVMFIEVDIPQTLEIRIYSNAPIY